MKYVFEDNGNDVFSELFKAGYSQEISSQFIYSKGAPNLRKEIEPLLQDGECVVAYMDLVPDNKQLCKIYHTLRLLSIEYNYNLVVLLIPCIEYEFIMSVSDLVDNKFTRRCKAYSPYGDLINDLGADFKVKSFEKYCKAVVKYRLLKCMSTDSRVNLGDCIYQKTECEYKTLIEKSCALLAQYPAIPFGVLDRTFNTVSGSELWEVHRESVKMYNDAVDRFNANKSVISCRKVPVIR